MISFTAKYISPVIIDKKNPQNGKFEPCKGCFIEFDSLNQIDINALGKISDKWNNNHTLAESMLLEAQEIFYNSQHIGFNNKPNSKIRFFGLTTQQTGFDIVDADKVLGLAEVESRSKTVNETVFLAVHPEHKYIAKNRQFKHVGEVILETIEKIFPHKIHILAPSDDDARAFYRKLKYVVYKKNSEYLAKYLKK